MIEERRSSEADVLSQITALDDVVDPTARELRDFEFTSSEGKARNGTWLNAKLSEVRYPGGGKSIFTDYESRLLSGLVVKGANQNGTKAHSRKEIEEILAKEAELHEELRLGGFKSPASLLTAYNKMAELIESNDRLLAQHPDIELVVNWFKNNAQDQVVDEAPDIETDSQEPKTPEVAQNSNIFDSSPELPIFAFSKKDGGFEADGVIEIEADSINKEALIGDTKEALKRAGGHYTIEPERAQQFVEILKALEAEFPGAEIATYRTLRPNWHTMPWYVIKVEVEGKEPLVIMETVTAPAATYVIHSDLWLDIAELRRTQARTFRAEVRAHNHEYDNFGRLAKDNKVKIMSEAKARLNA